MLAYFDCFSGVSGDMILGALVDAGLPLETLREQLGNVEVGGYRLEAREHSDHDLHGTRLEVVLDSRDQPARRLAEILDLLESSRLDSTIIDRARRTFERLALAEAAIHGVTPEEVHLHEVGAVDAIVDIVGAVAGLKSLDAQFVYASALPLGGGSVVSRHGRLPLPAPGTLEILARVGAPTRSMATEEELVTPTGAALMAELATFEQPPLVLRRIGYGFGRKQLPWPNCLRLWLADPVASGLGRDEVTLIEANLDDMTAEALGYAMERLFAAGALDVFFQPLQMKKSRPGVLLGVLARPAQTDELAALMLAETTTLGVRVSRLERLLAGRSSGTIETQFGALKVKIKQLGDRRIVSPEYDDAARLAQEKGVPLAEVYRAAAALTT
jgi:pyridinium-3,5-bisthiocarboxylic acid mononucleotide nickel chelatase